MSGINRVVLVGRVGRDAEVRYTSSGTAAANLSLATSETWKDKNTGEKKERTTWHLVSIFGRLAEVAGEFIRKGDLIGVQGRLENRKWTDKNGIKRETTEILADSFNFLAKGNSEGREERQSNQRTSNDSEPDFGDDIPF